MTIDSHIITDAQSGDPVARQKLISHCTPIIDRECRAFGLRHIPAVTVSDLNQEVKLHILNKLTKFSSLDAPNLLATFQSWVRVVTRNFLVNLVSRHQNKMQTIGIDTDSENGISLEDTGLESVGALAQREEVATLLRAAIAKLEDEHCQLILRYKVIHGLTFQEIAGELGLSQDQVRYRYYQTLEKLRFILNP